MMWTGGGKECMRTGGGKECEGTDMVEREIEGL